MVGTESSWTMWPGKAGTINHNACRNAYRQHILESKIPWHSQPAPCPKRRAPASMRWQGSPRCGSPPRGDSGPLSPRAAGSAASASALLSPHRERVAAWGNEALGLRTAAASSRATSSSHLPRSGSLETRRRAKSSSTSSCAAASSAASRREGVLQAMTGSRGLWRDLPRFNAMGQLESTGPEARHPSPGAFTPRGRVGSSVLASAAASPGEGGQQRALSPDDRNSLAATAWDDLEHAGQRISDRVDIGSLSEYGRYRALSADQRRPGLQTSGAHSSLGPMAHADSGRVQEANELAATSELCFPPASASVEMSNSTSSEASDAAIAAAALRQPGSATALQPAVQPATAEAFSSAAARAAPAAAAALQQPVDLGELELMLAASEQRLGGWMGLDDYVPGLAKVLGGTGTDSSFGWEAESVYSGKFDEEAPHSWKLTPRTPIPVTPQPPAPLLLCGSGASRSGSPCRADVYERPRSASMSCQLRSGPRSAVKVSQ